MNLVVKPSVLRFGLWALASAVHCATSGNSEIIGQLSWNRLVKRGVHSFVLAEPTVSKRGNCHSGTGKSTATLRGAFRSP